MMRLAALPLRHDDELEPDESEEYRHDRSKASLRDSIDDPFGNLRADEGNRNKDKQAPDRSNPRIRQKVLSENHGKNFRFK